MVARAQRPRGQQSERSEFQHLGAPLILLSSVYHRKAFSLSIGLLAQLVEDGTLVNTMFRVTTSCGFESLAVQLKINNRLSDETLNQGPV